MSGGFEYNLTRESEFEQLKQKYRSLAEQNQSLKKTLEQLLSINGQLSDQIEKFNNSQWARQIQQKSSQNNHKSEPSPESHDECQKFIYALEQQIEDLKALNSQKLNAEENSEIVSAIDGLIQSFKQAHKNYEEQIATLCEEIDNLKSEWENKIFKIEEEYFNKGQALEQSIREMRKKQQIVSILQKKLLEQTKGPRKILKKTSEIQTSGQRKMSNLQNQLQSQQAATNMNNMNMNIESLNKQIEELKMREKELNNGLKEKNKIIQTYGELLGKLRKKLTEKL